MVEPIAPPALPDIAAVRAALMHELSAVSAELDTALAELQASIVPAWAAMLSEGRLPDAGAGFPGPFARVSALAMHARAAWVAARIYTDTDPERLAAVVKDAAQGAQDERWLSAALGEPTARRSR